MEGWRLVPCVVLMSMPSLEMCMIACDGIKANKKRFAPKSALTFRLVFTMADVLITSVLTGCEIGRCLMC
jgi:hypothetical protein